MKKYKVYVKNHTNSISLKADHFKEVRFDSGMFVAFYTGDIDCPVISEDKVIGKNVTGLFASIEIISILDSSGSEL